MFDPELIIVWRITEICDLACPFCAYGRHFKNRQYAAANPGDVLRFGALADDKVIQYTSDLPEQAIEQNPK